MKKLDHTFCQAFAWEGTPLKQKCVANVVHVQIEPDETQIHTFLDWSDLEFQQCGKAPEDHCFSTTSRASQNGNTAINDIFVSREIGHEKISPFFPSITQLFSCQVISKSTIDDRGGC